VLLLFGAGAGDVAAPRQTGAPIGPAHAVTLLPSRVEVGGVPAEVLFAGEVPGFIGLTQLNVRLPSRTPREPRAEPVVWTVGSHASRSPVTVWIR
jgi:uncharacterized protein (TIGR03437 family)